MPVDYNDREDEVTYAHSALRLSELNVDYETTELILKTLEKLKELGSNYSIMDASKLITEHNKKWKDYYEKKQDEELKRIEKK